MHAKKIPAVGSRAQVYHGNAKHTAGGLTKKHLTKNKVGKIVSKKASMQAKKAYRSKLKGYIPKKGVRPFPPR
jgi:hypothetical protein